MLWVWKLKGTRYDIVQLITYLTFGLSNIIESKRLQNNVILSTYQLFVKVYQEVIADYRVDPFNLIAASHPKMNKEMEIFLSSTDTEHCSKHRTSAGVQASTEPFTCSKKSFSLKLMSIEFAKISTFFWTSSNFKRARIYTSLSRALHGICTK